MSSSPRIPTFIYDKKIADDTWAMLKDSPNGGDLMADSHYTQIAHLVSHSPYLESICHRFPSFITSIILAPNDDHYQSIIKPLTSERPLGETKDQLSQLLREAKAKVALLTAFMDIHQYWPLHTVTWHLTDFAEKALDIAVVHAVHSHMTKGDLQWPNNEPSAVTPLIARSSGYFALAMGKMGGNELNYSSDIDLIIFYDSDAITYTGRKSLQDCMVKITQLVVELMDRRTMFGYVFRTDLRLRPDPGSTPVAMSINAALTYYQAHALNWERSAMIKARPVAGDINLGNEFLEMLSSWIWRRSMDYEAMGDIVSMKEQINRHYNQHEICLENYDVKLGNGGIREIEFYVQINQLLLGGRHAEFRTRPTIISLENLANHGRVKGNDCSKLMQAYDFLRTVEHRIQMTNDEQTHSIPSDPNALDRLRSFMGYHNLDDFKDELYKHTTIVAKIYDELLPKKDTETADESVDISALLAANNFQNIDHSRNLIDQWFKGKYRALTTNRAKGLLRNCLTPLLSKLGENPNPDNALLRFDKFISKLPAGVQIFSMLNANPSLFRLIARIMGLAPSLADLLAKHTSLWDAMLEPDFFSPILEKDELKFQLNKALSLSRDYQDTLDIVRRWTNEKKFQIAVHTLEGLSDIHEGGPALTLITDVCLQALLPKVEDEFAVRHGRFDGGGIGMLAMGKYGGKELTFTSDLDVVFLYKVDSMDAQSDGPKPLGPSLYFSRLGQNIITAISAQTSEGCLYEVDTRLRPSGNQGPLVVTLKTFSDYYTDAAWTWEHMALTRARLIYAPRGMKTPLLSTIYDTLAGKRDYDELRTAVQKMRSLLFKQFGNEHIWNIKQTRGGLVDLEFIIQYLLLKYGPDNTDIFEPVITTAMTGLLSADILDNKEYEILVHSHWLQQTIQSVLRISMENHPNSRDDIPTGLKEILCTICRVKSFTDVEDMLLNAQKTLHTLYVKRIGDYLNLEDDSKE